MTRPTVVTDPAEIKAMGRRMSEADLQRSVVEACGWFGLLVFHSGDSRRDLCAGFPDLLIVGRRTILVELKSATGRVSVDQQRWITRLNASGTLATVWRPEHLLDGTVTDTLRNLAHPGTPEAHPSRPAAAPTALRGTPNPARTLQGPQNARRDPMSAKAPSYPEPGCDHPNLTRSLALPGRYICDSDDHPGCHFTVALAHSEIQAAVRAARTEGLTDLRARLELLESAWRGTEIPDDPDDGDIRVLEVLEFCADRLRDTIGAPPAEVGEQPAPAETCSNCGEPFDSPGCLRFPGPPVRSGHTTGGCFAAQEAARGTAGEAPR